VLVDKEQWHSRLPICDYILATVFHMLSSLCHCSLSGRKCVALAGSSTNAQDPNSVLHWRIFLCISQDKSVILDLLPEGLDSRTGLLMIKSAAYAQSQSTAASIPVAVAGEVTMGAFIDLVLRLKRNQYKYGESGSACHYWCSVVLEDMEKCGYVPAGSTARFHQSVARLAQNNPTRYPLPTCQGAFYVSRQTGVPSELLDIFTDTTSSRVPEARGSLASARWTKWHEAMMRSRLRLNR
jgi:hypothetical protein